MVTKAILKEQILRLINGGTPSDRDRFLEKEIEYAISDIANQLLKAETIGTMATQGQMNVDGLAVVTYENIDIIRDVNWAQTRTAQANLPAKPFMLEGGQGVQAVYPSGMPHLGYFYVPESLFRSWMKNRYVAPLHKRFYTYSGMKIIIYDDLFSSGENACIDVKLVISDITTSGENDPLPLLPEHRFIIVDTITKQFMQTPDTNKRETDQPSPSKRN